ncbi:MAG: right-handed parallel beta-helix repeat-containing protein, partial [Clostridia bacterium]|nr:right-handed parallel beta-helix repeat-containing protein [Clostridia bacterium]
MPLLTIFMAAALILTCTVICGIQGTVYAASGADTAIQADVGVDTVATVGTTEYTDFTSAWSAANDAGTATVTLYVDVVTASALGVGAGKNITLDLNGRMLKYSNSTVNSSVINVNGGNFTLTDSEKDLPQNDKTPHNYNVTDGLWIFDDNGGKTMYGGVLTGGTGLTHEIFGMVLYHGGGVCIVSGTFTMNGGTIAGNRANNGQGGGVCITDNSAEFTMNAGMIAGNKADMGAGGVQVNWVNGGIGKFTMTGGVITENAGDGVFINAEAAEFHMSGAPKIIGNGGENIKFTNDTNFIRIDGELTEGAEIWISGNRAAYTKDYAQYNTVDGKVVPPSNYFYSTDSSKLVTLNAINEVVLADPVVTVKIGEDGESQKFADIVSAFDYANNYSANVEIKLLADITSNASIAGEDVITLDLNGHLLKRVSNGVSAFITVEHDSTLRIIDSNATEEVKTPHDYYVNDSGVWIFVDKDFQNTENYEIKTLYGGVIAGSGMSDGWLSIGLGTVIMEGGAICGNSGSGVVVEEVGTLVMTGGRICGNGGGVRVLGTFKVSDTPIITDNKSTDGNDVNVWLQLGSKITVDDELKTGAKIGVKYEGGAGAVAAGYAQTDKPSNYFIPDGTYNCAYVSDEESGTVFIGMHDFDNAPWLTSATTHWKDCLNDCGQFMYSNSHHFDEEVVSDTYLKSSATCTAKAVYYKSCVCGAHGTDTFEDGEPAGHTLLAVSLRTATCTAFGELAHDHCTVCDKNFVEGVEKTEEDLQIAKVAHTLAAGVRENEKAATCTREGSYDEVVYCSVCGEELSRTPNTIDKIAHNEEIIPAVDATCTAKGKTEGKKCKDCDTVTLAQVETDMMPHTEATDNAVAPTCTADGKTEGKHCSVCGHVIVAQTTAPALGHYYGEWTVTKAATCTEGGSRYRVCTRNDEHIEEEDIAALGHDYGDWVVTKLPTAMQDGEQRRFCSHDNSHFEVKVLNKLTDFDPNKPSDNPSGLDNANKPSKSQFDWLIIVVVLLSLIIAGE